MARQSDNALAVPADRAKQQLKTIAHELERKRGFLQAMLPKEITPERLRALVLTCFQRNPKLLTCSVPSILAAVYEAAKIGLEPDTVGQECHLIPYKDKATFQLGFKGAMKLARRAGDVRQIWSEHVCSKDIFDYELGVEPKLHHKRAAGNNRGELTHAYACARFSDGYVQFRVVDSEEVERVKKTVKAKASGTPWDTHEPAMWEKTAIKRLCKFLPMPDSAARAIQLDDLAESGQTQNLEQSWEVAGGFVEENGNGATVTHEADSVTVVE